MQNHIQNLTFTAFDIETTGLTPVIDRIVEIGAVKFKNEEITDSFREMVDPEMSISPGAFAVNGITDDMVKGKPTIDQVLPEFVRFLGGSVPVAHNALFDVGFLAYDISRFNLQPAEKPVLDTMNLSKNCFPGLYSYSLENIAGSLNIQSEGFHRALADSEICMKIFCRCLSTFNSPDEATLDEVIRFNGPPLYFRMGDTDFQGYPPALKEALQIGKSVEIVYQDASGSETTRLITPLTVGYSRGAVMIEAFCHLRNAKRNFRLDRIVEIK